MKTIKTAFPHFAPYDRRGIETYLERQAEKGWMFFAFGTVGWKFIRIDPKKVHFAVTYYAEVSEYDSEDPEGLLSFRDYCAKAGWKFIDSNVRMQIFSSEDENPTPIETEVLTEVKNIHRIEKKQVISDFLYRSALFVICLLIIAVFIHKDAVKTLSNREILLMLLIIFITFLLEVARIIEYYSWHRRAVKTAVEENLFLDVKNGRRVSDMATLIFVMGLLMLMTYFDWITVLLTGVMVVLGCAIMVFVWRWIKERRYSRKENWVIIFVVAFVVVALLREGLDFTLEKLDYVPQNTGFTGSAWEQYLQSPPLSLEDMYGEESSCNSQTMWVEESWLVADYEVRSYGEIGSESVSLGYSVIEIKCSMLYDVCLESELRSVLSHGKEYVLVDVAQWGADSVYRLRAGALEWENTWLLCYSDRLVGISMREEPTPEQMTLVCEVLGK